MHFIVDEDMPRSTAKLLIQAGYKAVDVRDVGLRGAKDKEILAFAGEKEAIIITADVGFAGLSFITAANHYGLILVRVPNEFTVDQVNGLLLRSLGILVEEDVIGNIIVIEPNNLRIRRRKGRVR